MPPHKSSPVIFQKHTPTPFLYYIVICKKRPINGVYYSFSPLGCHGDGKSLAQLAPIPLPLLAALGKPCAGLVAIHLWHDNVGGRQWRKPLQPQKRLLAPWATILIRLDCLRGFGVFEDSGGSGVFNGNAVTIRMTNRLKERLAAETLIIALNVQPMPSP